MRKKFAELEGKRLFNRWTGQFGRVARVIPHGKTSARFVLKFEGSLSSIDWSDTYGEVMKHNEFVGEEYRHALPPPAERIRKMVAMVDDKAGGEVKVMWEHTTELDSYVRDDVNGRTVRDGFSLWRERGESKYVMGISVWGSDLKLSLEVTYKEINAANGNLWKVFKPMMLALADGMEKADGAENGTEETEGTKGVGASPQNPPTFCSACGSELTIPPRSYGMSETCTCRCYCPKCNFVFGGSRASKTEKGTEGTEGGE